MELVFSIIALLVELATLVLCVAILRRLAAGPLAQTGEQLAAQLKPLEQQLLQQFTVTASDTASRLERVKGELQQELSDRLNKGLGEVKTGVERQLAGGRQEQDQRLNDTVKRLEEKFDALTRRQTEGLGEVRRELTTTLAGATKTLEEKFAALENRTTANLETIRGKVDERLAAISEQVQHKLDQNIKEGFAQFEKVRQSLNAAEEQLKNVGALGASISDLNSLLKLPHLRGKFGEASLERLLADFLPAHMYELQPQASEDDRKRPDATIKFPDRVMPIDSKFPREQVLPLFETSDPEKLRQARGALERVIKEQAKRIKAYIRPEEGTTDVALMFLPSETLWFEVVHNRELSDFLEKNKISPVSPNTLLLAVRTIALIYQWYQVATGLKKSTEELAKAQRWFGLFQERFTDIGKSLQKAQDAFQTASGHLSRYQSRVTGITGESVPELESGTNHTQLAFSEEDQT